MAKKKDLMVAINPLLNVDIKQLFQFVASKYRQDVKDLNDEQLEAGKESIGNEITPAYKPITVKIKKAKGQIADRVTLKDTGSFRQKISASIEDGKFVIHSRDNKADALKQKYGDHIFGLTPVNKKFLGKEMLVELRENFRKALFIRK